MGHLWDGPYDIGRKISFSKFKRTEIIQSLFSDHNGVNQKSTTEVNL